MKAKFLDYNIVPLPNDSRDRGKGCYFCLDTKVTKRSSQQRGFFAAQATALQISPHSYGDWAAKIAPKARVPTLLQMLLCPATAQATIVLPDFARSFSADGWIGKFSGRPLPAFVLGQFKYLQSYSAS